LSPTDLDIVLRRSEEHQGCLRSRERYLLRETSAQSFVSAAFWRELSPGQRNELDALLMKGYGLAAENMRQKIQEDAGYVSQFVAAYHEHDAGNLASTAARFVALRGCFQRADVLVPEMREIGMRSGLVAREQERLEEAGRKLKADGYPVKDVAGHNEARSVLAREEESLQRRKSANSARAPCRADPAPGRPWRPGNDAGVMRSRRNLQRPRFLAK
jgi:hypothetical protein